MVSYRVIHQKDMTYGVEFTDRDRGSHTVTGFKTEAEAEAWIAEQKQLEDDAALGPREAWGEWEH
jgi:hypothetical protein